MHRLRIRRGRLSLTVGGLSVALVFGVPADASAGRGDTAVASAGSGETSISATALRYLGTGNLAQTAQRAARASTPAPATANPRTELPRPKRPNAAPDTRVTPAQTPNPDTTPVVGQFLGTLPFSSLSVTDSRYAFNGNQFTGEPPDQALCAGNGFAMASVNTAITVYDRFGAQLAPTVAINEFFGLAPEINRQTARPTFGPFAFDPVCYYDFQVRRWFYLVTELDQDVFTGEFTGGSNLFLAVSATDHPLGDYAFYGITTTSGDATDRGCPCLDDFPHLGADANGFYITANRFSIFGPEFNGAQIYAISKRGLARAAADPAAPVPAVVSINAGRIDGDPSFTLQPAQVPPGGSFAPNREYFLSTTDFDTVTESKIGLWALAGTDTLDTGSPQLQLTRTTIPSLTYALEPDTRQKRGRAPLADLVGEPLNKLDSQSDMTEVKFANGKLWAAISTAAGPAGGPKRTGILHLQVRPTFSNGQVGGSVVRQGYLAVGNGNSLLYPAVGVNAAGQGAIVASLAGPTVYPSPSYIEYDNAGPQGPVRVPEFGQRPEDGFTCYQAFVGSRARGCRWGDYSSATADEQGNIWMATEWISNEERLPLANWDTFVMRHRP